MLTALVIAGGVGFYIIYKNQQDAKDAQAVEAEKKRKEAEALTTRLTNELPDPGAIKIRSTPEQAGVWLKIGRTPVDSPPFASTQMHELRFEGVEGYQPLDTQVLASHWTGEADERKANISVTLGRITKDKPLEPLAAMPATPPPASGFTPGRGPIHIESVPAGAEVWLYVGMTNAMELTGIQAGAGYELRVLKDGFRPAYVSITPEEWRAGGDPNIPINAAKKKPQIEKTVTLEADTEGKPEPTPPPKKKKGG